MLANEMILEEEYRQDTLGVNIKWANNAQCQKYEYAFYLFRNDVRIATAWYGDKASVEFKLNESGIYHIVAFARAKGEQSVLAHQSSERYSHTSGLSVPDPVEERVCSMSIWGSCVSRDVLACRPNAIQLKTYVARQSIVSALSPPIQYTKEISLSSNFQKRMVRFDLEKQGLSMLKNDGSRFLLVDLIDERFDLACVNGSFVTLSNEMKTSGVIGNSYSVVRKEKKGTEFFVGQSSLDGYISRFSDAILGIYEPDHVIIHMAKLKDYYIDEQRRVKKFPIHHIWNNKRINEALSYMYDKLRKQIPQAPVIDVCDNYCADAGHKWGLAPMHYQSEYYERVLHEIMSVLPEKNI